jgi:radical SAM superfamily enzyme YgiQ (UPF0313 family)
MDLTPYVGKHSGVDSGVDGAYLSNHDITAYIITSYGCPFNCNFCSVRILAGGNIVFRSIDSVVKEVEYFIQKYNATSLVFFDDNILFDKERFKKLLLTLEGNGHYLTWKLSNASVSFMDDDIIEFFKNHGCLGIGLAVESGNKRVLREIINKPYDNLDKVVKIVQKCKTIELEISAGFIIGLPGETWQEIRNTIAFAETCDFDFVSFNIATVFPKTRLYETAISQNLLPPGFTFRKSSGFNEALLETNEFSPMELRILRAFEWDRINFSTPEKVGNFAKRLGITIAKLEKHRQETRQSRGGGVCYTKS